MALTDSLISVWKLNETGGNALDSHGSNNLTLSGSVGTGVGTVYSSARDFEISTSGFFYTGSNSTLCLGDIDATFAYWFKPESVSAGGFIINKDDVGTNREYSMDINGSAPRTYIWSAANAAGQVLVQSATVFSTGAWQFVVWEHNSTTNRLSIQQDNATTSTGAANSGVYSGSAIFSIGGRHPNGGLDGLFGPVYFWKRILTTAEKNYLYSLHLPYENFDIYDHSLYTNLPLQERNAGLIYNDYSEWNYDASLEVGSTAVSSAVGPGGSLPYAVGLTPSDTNRIFPGGGVSILTGGATIEFFAKRNDKSQIDYIFGDSSNEVAYIGFSSGTNLLELKDANNTLSTINTQVDTTTWHHYAVLVNSGAPNALGVTLYVDGVLKGSFSSAIGETYFDLIGAHIIGDVFYYNGKLAGIKLYSEPKSAAQILIDKLVGLSNSLPQIMFCS